MVDKSDFFRSLRVLDSRMRGLFTRRHLHDDFQQDLDSYLVLLRKHRRGMTPEKLAAQRVCAWEA